ncbi:MAG: tripartite tricarboxylate transporter substrate binding protein [Betaproteobacteria bacterium]|nr:tripartite tricarboxylate transporter substrate binding protein [Betaproteobacteria bacterium]
MKHAIVALVWLVFCGGALAQGYPSKPITFIIPFAAGGDSDLSGRNVATHAQKYLNNQPIVAVNRTGASGTIGAQAVRTAAPDGYTLLVARIATHAIAPALDSKVPYKWNEFTMLSLIELNPFICYIKSDAPWRNAAELIETARAHPGKLNFSTSGVGTSQNMSVQYWMTLAGLTKDHAVGIHYKGGGEVTTAVLGQQVHFACNNAPTVIPHVKSGALRGLFVTPERLAELPSVPSATEAGFPDMNRIVGWTALMGPPGMPKEVLERWVDTFARLAKDPAWQAGNARIGGIAAIRSPAETGKFVREQYELYARLVALLGIGQ